MRDRSTWWSVQLFSLLHRPDIEPSNPKQKSLYYMPAAIYEEWGSGMEVHNGKFEDSELPRHAPN